MVITGLYSSPSMCLQMNLLVHLKSSKETLSMGSLIVQEENLWGCPYRPRARMSVLQNQLLSAPHNIEWSTPSSLLGRKWSMMMNLWFLPSVLLDFIDILLKNMQINQNPNLLQIHTKVLLQCPNHLQSAIVLWISTWTESEPQSATNPHNCLRNKQKAHLNLHNAWLHLLHLYM